MKKLVSLVLSALLVLGLLGTLAHAGEAEIVDGRFAETRKITVEVYDRSNNGGSRPENNVFTNFIKEGMLRDHNVEVEFKIVPRFPEDEVLNNLLAAGDAPDVCVTYSYPTILTYANMDGVIDLAPYIEQYKDMLPNLFKLVGEDNIYYNQDPVTSKLWAVEARLFHDVGQPTFIREDWLAKLGMAEPTTLEEFEAAIYAFKDNAELLLGDDAANIIPYYLTVDVGWHALDIVDSVVPAALTDRELYIYGYDDRKLLYPNHKEAIRLLNKWYNDGLIWKDFSLYPAGDQTGLNLIKAGYVGAYTQNCDDPYRNGEDGLQYNMQRLVSEDAAFITIPTFKNENGDYRRYLRPPIDRKVFFPSTNDEPLASLLYLDWLCTDENRIYIQTGEEGINHEKLEDGSRKILPATGDYIFNSPNNIDYTILNNGLWMETAELSRKTLANGYGHIDPKYITRAYDLTPYTATYRRNPQCGEIKAEEGVDMMLKEKRDNMLNQAVVAPVDKFDEVYDAGMQDYLNSGGQAIIDERTAAWQRVHGDKDMLD